MHEVNVQIPMAYHCVAGINLCPLHVGNDRSDFGNIKNSVTKVTGRVCVHMITCNYFTCAFVPSYSDIRYGSWNDWLVTGTLSPSICILTNVVTYLWQVLQNTLPGSSRMGDCHAFKLINIFGVLSIVVSVHLLCIVVYVHRTDISPTNSGRRWYLSGDALWYIKNNFLL